MQPRELIGAWGYGTPDKRTVRINTDKVFSVATYDVPGKKFIGSHGGTWPMDGNKLIKKIEWNSQDSSQVGQEILDDVEFATGKLMIKQKNQLWSRLDDGERGRLMRAWIITVNFSNDSVSKRSNLFIRAGQ